MILKFSVEKNGTLQRPVSQLQTICTNVSQLHNEGDFGRLCNHPIVPHIGCGPCIQYTTTIQQYRLRSVLRSSGRYSRRHSESDRDITTVGLITRLNNPTQPSKRRPQDLSAKTFADSSPVGDCSHDCWVLTVIQSQQMETLPEAQRTHGLTP